jgi:FkbM family methyltransferase
MRGKLQQELSKLAPKVIFDIGACDFTDSISMKKQFPNAEVYAVEADPTNYERNYMYGEQLGVHTFNFAMSDQTGYITFYPSLYEIKQKREFRYAGSIIKPLLKPETNEALNHSVTYDTTGIEVKTKTFIEFCNEINVSEVDLLFIDVEGAEYKVLQATGGIKPKLIFAETAHYQTKNYETELDLNGFDELLFSMGYEIIERLQYDTLYKLI